MKLTIELSDEQVEWARVMARGPDPALLYTTIVDAMPVEFRTGRHRFRPERVGTGTNRRHLGEGGG